MVQGVGRNVIIDFVDNASFAVNQLPCVFQIRLQKVHGNKGSLDGCLSQLVAELSGVVHKVLVLVNRLFLEEIQLGLGRTVTNEAIEAFAELTDLHKGLRESLIKGVYGLLGIVEGKDVFGGELTLFNLACSCVSGQQVNLVNEAKQISEGQQVNLVIAFDFVLGIVHVIVHCAFRVRISAAILIDLWAVFVVFHGWDLVASKPEALHQRLVAVIVKVLDLPLVFSEIELSLRSELALELRQGLSLSWIQILTI